MSHFKIYRPDDHCGESQALIRLAVFDDEFEIPPLDRPQIISFANFRRGSNGQVVGNGSATTTVDRSWL